MGRVCRVKIADGWRTGGQTGKQTNEQTTYRSVSKTLKHKKLMPSSETTEPPACSFLAHSNGYGGTNAVWTSPGRLHASRTNWFSGSKRMVVVAAAAAATNRSAQSEENQVARCSLECSAEHFGGRVAPSGFHLIR